MTWKVFLAGGAAALAAGTVAAQGLPPRLPAAPANPAPPSLQSAADPGYAALIATCKTPPPAGRGRAGGGGRGGPAGGPPPPVPGVRDYTVQAIPGVIAAGQKWTFHWQEAGNNGDGIIGTNDGALLLAQNDNSQVLRLDKDGKTSVAYRDTHTGGAPTSRSWRRRRRCSPAPTTATRSTASAA
jgi:hypothetical protein